MSLEKLLTKLRPLGPDDANDINTIEDAACLIDPVGPVAQALKHHYTLIYGRKGSGKTSILSAHEGYRYLKDRIVYRTHLRRNPKRADIVILSKSWEHFSSLAADAYKKAFYRSTGANQYDPAFDDFEIAVEAIESAWVDILWEMIFNDIYSKCRAIEDSDTDYLSPSDFKYVIAEVEGRPLVDRPIRDDSAAQQQAAEIIKRAQAEVRRYLEANKLNLYILFDSMEKYPVKQRGTQEVIAGFVKCAKSFTAKQCTRAFVSFALPQELLPFLHDASTNIVKDKELSLALEWSGRELLRMVAHRYRLYLHLHHPNRHKEVSHFNLAELQDLRTFYYQILPTFICNENGQREKPIPYILRHSQLLPRHIIDIFNKIFYKHIDNDGDPLRIEDTAIVHGIQATEGNIARQTLQHLKSVHPDITNDLKSAFKDCGPLISYKELAAACKSLTASFSMDEKETMNFLYRIGVVGRVTQTGKSHADIETIYAIASFSYMSAEGIAFANKAEYCIHPVFSKLLGVSMNRGDEKRVVYPQGTPKDVE